jgi:acyl-CoA reductase-like NAD-dependent aldehyde dehydrogenase
MCLCSFLIFRPEKHSKPLTIYLLQLGNTLQEVPTLLRKLLKAALDPSIIEFVTSRASDADLGPNHIRVFQSDVPMAELQPSLATSFSPLISPSRSRVVAVVDRTADLAKAAAALVTARLSFGGNSPYAPDVILVNEYVKKAFLVAVMEELIKFTANLEVVKAIDSDRAADMKSLFEAAQKSSEVEVTTSTGRGSVYEVKNR